MKRPLSFAHCNQVSRLEAEKLELTGSLCSMQQKLTELEVITQDLEEERVSGCRVSFTCLLKSFVYLHNCWNCQPVLFRNITACISRNL